MSIPDLSSVALPGESSANSGEHFTVVVSPTIGEGDRSVESPDVRDLREFRQIRTFPHSEGIAREPSCHFCLPAASCVRTNRTRSETCAMPTDDRLPLKDFERAK
jgi:hypothetical protein